MKSFYNFSYVMVLLNFFVLSWSHANKVGNGGDGIFCKDKSSGELLDFYERDMKFDTSTTSYESIATEQIKKLKDVAPKLYERYQKRLKEIESEIEFKRDISLVDVDDSHHVFVPKNKNCIVHQLAIRKLAIAPNEKRFIIDDELWKRLNSYHKAGLIMHEIIYEHFFHLGEINSVKARQFNGYLFSIAVDKPVEKKDFWHWMQNLEVPIYP